MRLLDNAVGRVCIALITAMALLITGGSARTLAHFGLRPSLWR